MGSLEEVFSLRTQGRFMDALRALEAQPPDATDRQEAEALRADLFEQVGRHGQARATAERLLRSKTLSPSVKSLCEFVLARLDRENGSVRSSIDRLQRSVAWAIEGQDL